MFEKYKNGDTSAIHPNIRGSVYSIVLREGGEAEVSSSNSHPKFPHPQYTDFVTSSTT